jgi:hypothetical protein
MTAEVGDGVPQGSQGEGDGGDTLLMSVMIKCADAGRTGNEDGVSNVRE